MKDGIVRKLKERHAERSRGISRAQRNPIVQQSERDASAALGMTFFFNQPTPTEPPPGLPYLYLKSSGLLANASRSAFYNFH
jgi:hypothetical protein